MKCKSCGYEIETEEALCPNCKVMLDLNQIKELKKEHEAITIKEGMVSERYGKDFIYKKREELNPKYTYLFIFLLFFFFIILFIIGIVVYF